jgi:hypothetical protein
MTKFTLAFWILSSFPCGAASSVQAAQSVTVNGELGGKTLGVWSCDALLAVDDAHSQTPLFRVFGRDGVQIGTTALTIPGADLINVYSRNFWRDCNGLVAVAGSAYSPDSKAGSFLALLSGTGQAQTIVRTSPLAILAVAIASDGTIWAAGRELVNGKEGNPDHLIINRFDKTGKLMGSAIPRSSLPGGLHPATESYLISAADRVGWYSPRAQQYIEFHCCPRQDRRVARPAESRRLTAA